VNQNTFDGEFPDTADGPYQDEKPIPESLIPTNAYVNLSPENQMKVSQLREEVKDWIPAEQPDHHMHTDFYLSRYLVARDFDVAKAKEMFINAMKWRKDNDIDGIIQRFESSEYFDLITNYWPCSVHRKWDFWTYDNSFIVYERIGSMDCSLIDVIPWQSIVDYHIWVVEVIEKKHAKIAKTKGYSPGGIVIEDLSGLGMGHAHRKVLEYLTTIAKIDESYYPAILRKYYIINAPYVFTMMWKVVQTLFSAQTLAKFEILGSDKEANHQIFKQIIPEKYLPDYLGGTSKFQMPKAGYQPDLIAALPKPNYEHKVEVASGKNYLHKVTISEPSVVQWQFTTKDHDIGFSVVHKDNNGTETEVVPHKRVESNVMIQTGHHLFEQPGTCVFVFDNSYSFWNAKELSLNVKSVPVTGDLKK